MADNQQQKSNATVTGFHSFHRTEAKQAIPLFSGEIGEETIYEWIGKADKDAQLSI